MDSKEIDKLFEEIRKENYGYLFQCADMKGDSSLEVFDDNGEFRNDILKIIYKKIKEGDYSHFLTKLKGDNYYEHRLVIYLIKSTEEPGIIDDIIQHRKELEVSPAAVKLLIEESNNREYIERKEEFGLTKNEIIRLIKSINDLDYTEECITRKEEFGFNKDDIVDLVASTHNSEFIDKYLKQKEEFGFAKFDIMVLLTACHNTKIVKKYLEKKEKYGFSNYEVLSLISSTQDAEFIAECIEKRNELGFDKFNVMYLIQELDNTESLRKYIERRKEFGFSSKDLKCLIQYTKDSDFIYECIWRNKEFEFNKDDIVHLISEVKKTEYLKEFIEKRRQLGLNKIDVIKLIKRINDPNYTNEHIVRKKEFGWDDKDAIILALLAGNDDYISKLRKYSEVAINLPENMTIGIEIESIGEKAKELLTVDQIDEWKYKEDISIVSDADDCKGVETVSSVFEGSNVKTTEKIEKMCSILEDLGQYTNETCGGHIHIGANYLTSIQAWQNFLELWTNTESALYIIGNKEGELPRVCISHYATPISKSLELQMNKGSINFEDVSDLQKFKEQLILSQNSKDKGVNFYNIYDGGMQTIEFRLSNGTIDAKTWIENINLYGGLVKTAEDLSIIQQKDESERTKEEQEKLDFFENIRNKRYDEKEICEQLLQIVIPEENRECYRQRYKVNSELLKADPNMEYEIRTKVTDNSVKVNKKTIDESVIKGEDRITGEEYDTTSQNLSDLMRNKNEKIESK